MNYFARSLMEGMARPMLVRLNHLNNAEKGEVTSVLGLVADLRALASADLVALADPENVQRRHNEVVASYGIGNASPPSKPFPFANGAAIIPVHGTLVNRLPYSFGFATGFNYITNQLALAMADPDVEQIIYDVNSYGGMAAGCPECAATINAASAANGGKPSTAMIDTNCYSAAYYLASACDQIVCSPSGGAGSIGVLMMHADYSKLLADVGIKVTFIHAGDHKVDGNPYEPLSEEVTSYLQGEIDKLYDRFVGDVSTYRANLSEQQVRDTEARIYQADDALAQGLIDSVQMPSDALRSLFANDDTGDEDMAVQNNTGGNNTALSQADVDQAAANARTAERERVSGILNHAEAEGRTKLATHLAMNTGMSVEEAGAILKESAKEAAAVATATETQQSGKETNHFKNAMDNGKHPNVGGENNGSQVNGGSEGDGQGMSKSDRILAAQAKASGSKKQADARK